MNLIFYLSYGGLVHKEAGTPFLEDTFRQSSCAYPEHTSVANTTGLERYQIEEYPQDMAGPGGASCSRSANR